MCTIQVPTKNSKPIWLSNPSYTHLLSKHPTLLSLLQNSNSNSHLKQIHAHILKSHDPNSLTALLEFSALSDPKRLDYAIRIFRSLNPPTIFAFNTLLRSLSASNHPHQSVHLFLEMLHCGIAPNKYTYPFVLKSFSAELALLPGKTIHGHAVKAGSASDPFVHSSLINIYSICGEIMDALKLFDRTPNRDVVCWSAMISGLVRQGRFREALGLFNEFQIAGLEPNESIMVSLLCTSAHLGALEQGKWVHMYIQRNGVHLSIKLGTALINMYCKCGVVEDALKLFGKMKRRNVLVWTALISGLAINGMGRRALDMYQEMLRAGIRPDSVTFVAVLTACSHGGLVEEARECFDAMRREHRLIPKVEHYGCMVDVLGRAGLLNEALDFIKSMPIEPDIVLWRALLNACSMHRNVEMGEFVGKFLIHQDPLYDGNYILLSNVYAQAKRWADAIVVRNIMKERGVKKCPGCSTIEFNGVVHEFFVGDKSDPQFKELRPMLDEMSRRLKSAGYVPTTSEVLLDIDEDEKQEVLCYHSEKLAIAFGLLNIDSIMPIRIVKNLRACVDCHSATKIISMVFDREIIVRDRSRFHHFKGGACSCQDFW
ncbi:hypothetical protein MRB53_013468 [Persea americana]|uniref:Uncharacterized protein n=1 Tax=Persea americana TaxID=3435 RepID=A0ACC2K8I3_PERAE|nr:hypothetical protein MRB53_013468 [Persea americana]